MSDPYRTPGIRYPPAHYEYPVEKPDPDKELQEVLETLKRVEEKLSALIARTKRSRRTP